MKKNVASQSIGAEMITAADGTAFTGTVTVLITIDNGTQSASGGTAPTHEGNGYHSYTPTQAETNGDHIAFTFTGTGAIPATVQVFTAFPQTVDNNVLAAGATGFAAIDTVVDAILVDTAEIGAAGAGLTNIGTIATVTNLTNLPTIPANWLTAAGIAASALDGKGDWNIGKTGYALTQAFPSNFADMSITLTTGLVDITQTAADKAWSTAARVLTANTNLNDPTSAAISDAVWDELLSGHAISGSTGEALSAAGTAGDPWTTALPGAYGAGTAGKIVGDNINATVSSRMAEASINTTAGAIDNVTLVATTTTNTDMRGTDSAALASALTTAQNDLDIITGASGVNLLTATQATIDAAATAASMAALNNIAATDIVSAGAITTLTGAVVNVDLVDTCTTNTDMRGTNSALLAASINLTGGAVDTVTDVTNQVTADTTAIAGVTVAATNLSKSAIGIEPGAAITGTLSTTQMTTDLTEVTDDHYNGRIIVWTSGVLKNQATDITDYTGASKLLTYTATTEAPANTDTFVII